MTRLRNKTEQLKRLQDIATSKGGTLISTEFLTAKTKYKFICKDNHEFELTSDKVVSRGDWCPYCSGRYGDFQSRYKNIIENIHKGKMLSDYINIGTKIHCECLNGHLFSIEPRNLLAGKWCAKCNTSHGEKAIANYLKEHNISYISEYCFDDCKNKLPLPFDFAVFKDDKLIALIEYDGEQHYRPMRHSSNMERNIAKFKQTQMNDEIKNKYCNSNNINLIRISFFDVDERRVLNLKRDIKEILDIKLQPLLT